MAKGNGKKEKKMTGYVRGEVLVGAIVVSLLVGYFANDIIKAFRNPDSEPAQTAFQQPEQTSANAADKPAAADPYSTLKADTEKNPDSAPAWTALGNAYYDNSLYPQAIEAYEKSLSLETDNPNVITDLGVMYRRIGNPEKALELFTEAFTIDPDHQMSRFNKGIVLMYDLQDPAGAVAAWEELLSMDPGFRLPNGDSLRDLIEEMKKR